MIAVIKQDFRRTPPGRPEGAPRVLIVDDEAAIATATQLLLELDGFEARDAGDGEGALQALRDGFRPDVLVTDYRLPTYDGLEVIRRVRQALGAEIPAVLVTGDTALEMAPDAPRTSAVLFKPVRPDGLSELLARLAAEAPLSPAPCQD